MNETSFAHILFATGVPGKHRRACPVLTGWAGSFTLPIFQGSFLLTPGFFPESEEISAPPPCGFLMGMYLFSENWSTETFRKA
jgi:hypothetical protein